MNKRSIPNFVKLPIDESELIYDIPVDSVVKMKLKTGHSVIGTCLANPKFTAEQDVVELQQVQVYAPEKDKTYQFEFRKYFPREIIKLTWELPKITAAASSSVADVD